MAITSEKMNEDLKLLNDAVDKVAAVLPEGTQAQFMERAGAYLEKMANRVDLQRQFENAVPRAQATLQPVVEESQRIASVETSEAEDARRVADRAADLERRAEAAPLEPSGAPVELDTRRSMAREAERLAATEAREAAAAREAQRALTANAAAPISASLVVDTRLEALRREQAEALQKLSSERGAVIESESEAEQ